MLVCGERPETGTLHLPGLDETRREAWPGESSTTGTWVSQAAAFPSNADPADPASGLHGPTGSLFARPLEGACLLFGRWWKPREVESGLSRSHSWQVEEPRASSGSLWPLSLSPYAGQPFWLCIRRVRSHAMPGRRSR